MKHYSLMRIAVALLLAITLSLTIASPALALDLNPEDYFTFSFDKVAIDKSEVAAGEVFHVTITGSASCIKDLPLPISEITITSQVVARPIDGSAGLILNPKYVIDINPLPNKAGQSFGINQSVTLQFPAGTAPGSYSVIGQVTSAKVKVIISIDVTSSFSQEQSMGTVKCIVPKTAATATPTAAATVPPPVTIPPASSIPATTTLSPEVFPAIKTTTLLAVAVIGLIIVVVVLVIILVVVLRRRGI